MNKIKRLINSSIFMTIILAIFISINAYATPTISRLFGNNRYETASKVAIDNWKQSNYAILTYGEDYPDALSAAPLAGKYNAPILLTQKNIIPVSTLSAISQLGVKNIFLIGGAGVISYNIEKQLIDLGISVTRLYGKNRYETNIQIAKQLSDVSQIAVVTGEDYSDALSIGPIAVKLNMPIILVGSSTVPQVVKEYIVNKNINKTYVIGKGTSINNIDGLPNVIEINGQDKYARNMAIINNFKNTLDLSSFYLTTGENFADGLSSSVLAGLKGNPLLLVGNEIKNQKDLLQSASANINIKIIGGLGAVSNNTERILTNGKYVEDQYYVLGEYNGNYTGFVINDIPIGQGTFSSKEPDGVFAEQEGEKFTMSGIWTDGHMNGIGTKSWEKSKKYIGNFKKDKMDGKGTMIWTEDKKYVGDFKNDKIEGLGTVYFKSGDKYVGQFKDDAMEGQGTYTWTNGNVYVGHFSYGNIEGQGTMTWANGVKYKGQFEDGRPNGHGIMTWATGEKYEGQFENGNIVR